MLSGRLLGRLGLGGGRRWTHVLRRVCPLPVTAPGAEQARPWERQDYMIYEESPAAVEVEAGESAGSEKLSVILNGYVEGLGNWGDVLDVDKELGRKLILLGEAEYDSPFNAAELQEERKRRGLTKRKGTQGSGALTMRMAQSLRSSLIPLPMSLDNEWRLSPAHVRVALRQMGFWFSESSIVLGPEPPRGPSPDMEGALVRIYLVVNQQMVLPVVGRIRQTGRSGSGGVVVAGGAGAEEEEAPTKELLARWSVPQETVYIHPDPPLDPSSTNVFSLMTARIGNK